MEKGSSYQVPDFAIRKSSAEQKYDDQRIRLGKKQHLQGTLFQSQFLEAGSYPQKPRGRKREILELVH
jgi:hypothetical protein